MKKAGAPGELDSGGTKMAFEAQETACNYFSISLNAFIRIRICILHMVKYICPKQGALGEL